MTIEEEKIFCLEFENNTLKNSYLKGETERWVFGNSQYATEKEHLERYYFASNFVKNKTVLDLSCGAGYGSFLLADMGKAKKVIGCDIDAEAVKYGNLKYKHPNVDRVVADVTTFNANEPVDVVVSFETIEHITTYQAFIDHVTKILKPGGLFIVSTPIVIQSRTNCPNPYHLQEWSIKDFHSLIRKNLTVQDTYLQSVTYIDHFLLLKRIINRFLPNKLKFKTLPDIDYALTNISAFKSTAAINSGYQIVIGIKS
ncbi:MAG: methyltransferase domain-containing protein [Saprospiraceae bacterium]|nr:methyltransferase domain-containing protein [Saprospiraceae bacterium]